MLTKEELKKEARKLVEDKGIKPTHAHEVVAKSYGFNTYNHFLFYLKEKEKDGRTYCI